MTKTVDKLIVCTSSGVILTVLEVIFGSIDTSLSFLWLVMIIDFITGILCGAEEHELSSDICIRGLFKKLFILVYVIIGHWLDILLGVDYIRTAICYMYATGEVLSIIENGARLGVPIPEPIKKALEVINGGEDNED